MEKEKNNTKRLKRIVCLFFLLVSAVVSYFAYRYYREDREQEEHFEQLEELEEERDNPPVSPKEITNPDWIAWLKIKDTSISYPVMQRRGDSEFYLHRDFNGDYSFYGTPFLDFRCTLESDNCIIYGHNINGGRMFGALHAYAKEDYYKAHPDINFRAGEEKRVYQIVSVMQTTTASSVYSFTEVGNWEEYQNYVRNILSGSLYRTEMGERIEKDMTEETLEEFFQHYQFLTLSTCRSWAGRDSRLLVIAARERDN